jgi:hypothetical protein
MKIVELINGKLQLPITNEEAEVLDKFDGDKHIARRELNEREVYIANQLVNKDVLTRKNNNGQISYIKKIKD